MAGAERVTREWPDSAGGGGGHGTWVSCISILADAWLLSDSAPPNPSPWHVSPLVPGQGLGLCSLLPPPVPHSRFSTQGPLKPQTPGWAGAFSRPLQTVQALTWP